MYGAKKLLIAMMVAIVGVFSVTLVPQEVVAQALRIITPTQGGTGIGSATAGQIGNCIKVLDDSPFTYELGACGTGGSSGGTDTLFNWNSSTNIISTDGASTTATTSLTTNGFTANSATITNATSTTGFFSSMLRALNAIFTNATTTNLQTTQFGVSSDYITDLTGTGLSIVGGALTATNDHVPVTVSGVRDYITLSGQDIVRGVVDISDDTNLSADGTEIILTGDALSLGTALTFTSATTTNLATTFATTSVFYGAGLTDCDSATGALTWDSSTGKFGCNSIVGGGGGSGGGWATTTDNNAEVGEIITYTPYDAYIGGSSSSTAVFNFDQDSSLFTIGTPGSVATGSILTQFGVLLFGSSTAETINFDFRTNDIVRLTSSTSVSAFDFGSIRASSTYASSSVLTVHGNIYSPKSDGCASWSSGILTTTGVACGSGGGGGSISTSSIPVAGNLAYWTSASALSDVATGTLTETVTGLELSATRGLVGGSAILSLTNGYTVPTTSSTTEWGTFYQTPSTRITAGNHIDWTGNTLDVVTTGDWTGTLDGFEGVTLAQTNWLFNGTRLSPSTTVGIGVFASSTISALSSTISTSTSASSTNFFSTTGTLTNLFFTSGIGTNATITNATTTQLFTTTASGSTMYGFGLTDCDADNQTVAYDVTTGKWSCGDDDTGGAGTSIQTFSYIVDADGGGDFTTIQGALDQCAVDGGGSIYLSDPYYYIGGTGLVFKSNDCQVYGIYASTTIEIAGATTAFKTNSPAGTYANVGVHNVIIVGDGTAGSVGIDMSDMIRSRYFGIIMDNVGKCFALNDTQNVTFYNTVRDFVCTTVGDVGIDASSTNPTNDNKFTDGFIGCTADCNAIRLNNAQANSFFNISIEPGTNTDTTGVRIGISNTATNNGTFGNTFFNMYIEGNAIGVAASSSISGKPVLNNSFHGGQIVANTTDIVDNSNGGGSLHFNGAIVNYEVFNRFATTSIRALLATSTQTVTASSTYASTTALSVYATSFLNLITGNNATITNATTTTLSATSFKIGSDVITDITGTNLSVTNGVLSASGGSGGSSNWLFDGTRLTPSTTVGIGVFASSTISDLSSTNATATNLVVPTSINLFGGGAKTTANALCTQLTGSADLCDGSDGGGGGSSKWTDGTNFTYLTNTTYDLALGSNATETAPFWWDVSATTSYIGNGGAGDSVITFGPVGTEWTMGFDDTDDSFRISSSTSLGQFNFLVLQSTTTILSSAAPTLLGSNDMGHRVGIGTASYYNHALLDQLVVAGRQRNADWANYECYDPYNATALSADAAVLVRCPNWVFYEDSTETLTGVASNGFTYTQLGGPTSGGGAMVGINGAAASHWMRIATNTPSFEVTARIGANVANASSTYYLIGYHNTAFNSATMEVMPTAGCFFLASSTQSTGVTTANTGWANWIATCKTSNTASTSVDTGISSTTITTGQGAWRKFRIDVDGTEARFYIKNSTGDLLKVATINTNIPSTTAMVPAIMFGKGAGTQALQFDFYDLSLWMRKIPPPP